jgi:hypothetical protein
VNIFATDDCPVKSALSACDSHAVKMPLEVAQMLSTAIQTHVGKTIDGLYKPAYQKHPCTIWAGETRSNFVWLVEYGLALCETYSDRYGKVHSAQAVIERCIDFLYEIPEGDRSPFVQCINVAEIQALGMNAIESYRLFMAHKYLTKRKMTSTGKTQLLINWNKVACPEWLAESEERMQELISAG